MPSYKLRLRTVQRFIRGLTASPSAGMFRGIGDVNHDGCADVIVGAPPPEGKTASQDSGTVTSIRAMMGSFW